MASTLNISAYRFVALSDVAAWRDRIFAEAVRCRLKGTVLLAEEGINLAVAGLAVEARAFASWLLASPVFEGLDLKETWSDDVPFAKLFVKVKPEIIRMNRPTIKPQHGRAPAVDPATFARWLGAGHDDEGRRLLTLDTRNDFEVDAGRIKGALDWRLTRFSDFPAALAAHVHEFGEATVVAYCTGGIRCEKATLVMREQGLAHVFQLEGGLLAYFNQERGRHFDGDCVVFDGRGAIDTDGRPVCHAGPRRD